MKSDWNASKLGDLISYISKGIAPKYAETESKDTIYVLNQKCNRDFLISYSAARLNDTKKKKVPTERLLQIGDILINSTGTGTAGRIAQMDIVPTPTTVDGHMIIVRANADKIDPLYLGYALKSKQAQVEELAEGSTGQTEINRTRLCEEVIVSYPKSKHEQRKIADLLVAIDQKSLNNSKINDNLAA